MVVKNDSSTCLHVAITGTNTDLENANDVCCQAILYRSTEDDPDLHYSVYDSLTQTLYFRLFSPSGQVSENVSYHPMREEDEIAEWLKICIVLNAEDLRRLNSINKVFSHPRQIYYKEGGMNICSWREEQGSIRI
jgi:hypothetical protein